MKALYNKECKDAHARFERERIIGGLNITYIPEPPPANKIDNYGLSKHNRVFKPIDLPEIEYEEDEEGNIVSSHFVGMSKEAEIEFLDRIWQYITEGYFFYNGDDLEYITGSHWYFLNLIKLDVVKEVHGELMRVTDNPHYIDGHRDVFLFWRQCEIERRCFGMILITRRRFAKTSIALALCLQAATFRAKAKVGFQAQTGEVAEDNFDKLKEFWSELPRHPFFFPTHAGSDNPAGKLEFRNPTKRKSKSQHIKSKKVLNSWIGYKSSKPNAYDGAGLWRYYLDEASKIDKYDLNEIFDTVRESMAHGSVALGKMIITSTAENIGGKTLEQFETLWANSDMEMRNNSPMKMTSSGLYRLFIPADIGYTHDEEEDGELPPELRKPTIDRWGNSDRETARKVILGMRALKSGEQLIRYIRKYPLDVNEAFSTAMGASPFDIEKLNQQVKFNRDLEDYDQLEVVRGNFNWVGKKWSGKVRFDPKEDGRWLVAMHPVKEDQCRIIKDLEGRHPSIREFWTGIDPYDHDMTVESGSDGAAFTWCNIGKYTDRIVPACVYQYRPPTVEELAEDFLKQCCYYSSYALIENQRGQGVIRDWKRNGFGGFILKDPLKDSKTDGFSTKSNDTRDEMINKLRTYIFENIGKIYQEDGTIRFGHFPFIGALEEFRKFETLNWTPYDITVAAMAGLHAIPDKVRAIPKITLDDLVPTFDNTGNVSTPSNKKQPKSWDWF